MRLTLYFRSLFSTQSTSIWFKSFKYRKSFILSARKNALNIHSSSKLKNNTPIIPFTYSSTSQPLNIYNKLFYDKLTKLGIPIKQTTSQTIKNFTNISKSINNITTSHAGIYSIPCNDYDKYYIGETHRNLDQRIYECKQSIKLNDDRNTLFKRAFNFSRTFLIKLIHCRKSRRLLETAIIFHSSQIIKQRSSVFYISPY